MLSVKKYTGQKDTNILYYVAKFVKPANLSYGRIATYYDVVKSNELHLFNGQIAGLVSEGYKTFNEALNYITTNKL